MLTINFSLVETDRLDRIEIQLRHINKKLDALLKATVSPEQLIELTQIIDESKNKSDVLAQTIQENKENAS